MIPECVVFKGLVRIVLTLDVVNDKKCVIVLFNLHVFVLSCSSPFPHLTKLHTDDAPRHSGHGRAAHVDGM